MAGFFLSLCSVTGNPPSEGFPRLCFVVLAVSTCLSTDLQSEKQPL